MKQKVSIVTLGCAKNQADMNNLTRSLRAHGHAVVESAEEADAIVVHTCSFIEAAKKESVETILQASQYKAQGKKLIVSGCLVQQHGEELFNELPEVDAFLGTGQLAQIPMILDAPRARFIDRASPGGYMDPDAPMETPKGPTAYLRLSEGCSHPCSFCVIPRLRGPVQSRTEEAILKEARALTERGVEELVIIGQDTGDWGRENRLNKGLPSLLRSVRDLPGVRWIRLMYMHPVSFNDELLSVFAEDPDHFPYLDMPFQHIDSDMLSRMKRKTDEASLRSLIERIQKRAPKTTLRTTFIVGFPGETDAQHDRLIRFVQEGFFDYLGGFSYSQEDSTPAAQMADQIPDSLKKERLTSLMDTFYAVAESKAEYRVGTEEMLLLEESEGDEILARSRREAPDIDAIIRLPQSAARGGRFINAKLTGYSSYEYTAVPV